MIMVVLVMMAVVMVMTVVVMVMGVRIRARAQRVLPRRQLIDTRPLEGILRLEERAVDGECALQIEGADVEHPIDRNVRVLGTENARRAVDCTHPTLDAFELGRADEVGLVEQNDIRESDLLAGLFHFVEMLLDVASVDQRDDGIEQELLLEIVVQKKRLRDRAGIGHAGGFDDDVVELVTTLQQLPEDAQQVAAHRAADAAVVRLEDFFFGADHQLVIHTDLTELVFDDGDALAVVLREDAIEESGLSRPEKSRQDGDGDPIHGSHRLQMIT
jgi:hypothetical protein